MAKNVHLSLDVSLARAFHVSAIVHESIFAVIWLLNWCKLTIPVSLRYSSP